MRDFKYDLRLACRHLTRNPASTVVAILTLALGIGATTAIFSVAHSVLLRPLPVPEPEELVLVWETNPDWGQGERNVVSSGNFMDWRDRASVFDELAAFSWQYGVGITGAGSRPERVMARRATPELFEVLGVTPLYGRIPSSTGDREEEEGPAVFLGHGLFQRRFGGDPEVIGKRIQINESPVTVLAVLPPEIDIPALEADLWFPRLFDEEDRESRKSHQWQVIGRLRPGITLEKAQAEMEVITEEIRRSHPQFMEGFGVRLIPFRDDLVREVRPFLLILLGVAAAVLLIACANVANLLLARGVARGREFAIRRAIGAGRGRLIRQVLTESGILAAVGGISGLALAVPGTALLRSFAPSDIPLLEGSRIDATVLAVTASISILSTLVFGTIPALYASRIEPERALREARGTSDRKRSIVQRFIVQFQIVLCVLLLISAGLLFRSFLRMQTVEHGFNPENLLAASLDLPYSRYDGSAEHVAFYESLIDRIGAIPGVVSVAGTPEPPVVSFKNTFSFVIDGRPRPGADPREDPVEVRPVTPDYLRTMEIPLVRGRPLDHRDRADSPLVAVVNESLARKHWREGNAVGARISFDDELEEGERAWIEIVGIAADTRHYGLDQPAEPALYMPHAQKRWDWMSWMTLMIRTTGDPLTVAPSVRAAVWELDDQLPIHRLEPVTQLYAESHARRRFAAQLFGLLATLAMFLGAVGVYGVVSYGVAQRRRELGIRLALGAETHRIAASVVADGVRLTLLGIVFGVLAALGLAGALEGLLFGVSAHDPATFVTVAIVLTAVAATASWIPARRAMRVDPVESLRQE